MFSIVSEKLCTSGMSVDMAPNRSPIVEISSPGIMDLRKATPAVTITMASSAPGRRLEILGVKMIIARENRATQSVGMSIWSKFRRYTPHLPVKSPGRFFRPRPKKSLICVDRMVRAIPAVKPTTIG